MRHGDDGVERGVGELQVTGIHLVEAGDIGQPLRSDALAGLLQTGSIGLITDHDGNLRIRYFAAYNSVDQSGHIRPAAGDKDREPGYQNLMTS